MRGIPFTFYVVIVFCVYSCKKNSGDLPVDGANVTSLNQSVFYKIVATVPSPADLAKGILRDSLSVSRNINKSDPEFLTNIPNVNANILSFSAEFSFGYDDPDKPFPYFSFSAYTFPGVPREFLLNKIYENATIPGSDYQRPLYLGNSNGLDGMTFFVDNIFPPDAQFPSLTKTYANIVFTKKYKIPIPFNMKDTVLFGSGHIVGYCIDYYNSSDTLKYKQRWDFWVDFTDLKIDP